MNAAHFSPDTHPGGVVIDIPIPTPPAEHPRLLLRAEHLAEIKQKAGHPKMKDVWERIVADGNREFDEGGFEDLNRADGWRTGCTLANDLCAVLESRAPQVSPRYASTTA